MSPESSLAPERLGRLGLFSSIAPAQLVHVSGLLDQRAIVAGTVSSDHEDPVVIESRERIRKLAPQAVANLQRLVGRPGGSPPVKPP